MEQSKEFKSPLHKIVSVDIRRLYPHSANPNRLSDVRFRKLVHMIRRTRQYEPLVVRRHPLRHGAYQVLNGHYRLKALKELGFNRADCVVFRADDQQSLIYLATLNGLGGRENVIKKARLVERLCKKLSSREISAYLAESRPAIEKLAALAKSEVVVNERAKPALLPLTFFVNETEHELLCRTFDRLSMGKEGTRTEKRIRALCEIAKDYLDNNTDEKTAVK